MIRRWYTGLKRIEAAGSPIHFFKLDECGQAAADAKPKKAPQNKKDRKQA